MRLDDAISAIIGSLGLLVVMLFLQYATIRGRVVDERGVGIPGVAVYARTTGDLDDDGDVDLADVAVLQRTINVEGLDCWADMVGQLRGPAVKVEAD